MSKLESIAEIFQACGKADTPVAVIQNGTLPQELMVIGTVRDIVFRIAHAGLTNPAIIIIGEVVRLHPSLVATEVEKLVQSQEA